MVLGSHLPMVTQSSPPGNPEHTPGARSPPSPPGVEAPAVAGTALPVAAVPRVLLGFDVEIIDVVHQVLQEVEELVALWAGGWG